MTHAMSLAALTRLDTAPRPDRESARGEATAARLVARGRRAMAALAGAPQARLDEAATALAWSHCRPESTRELAEIALRDTRLGNLPDKIDKVQRKTTGVLRDILRVPTTGPVEEMPERGLVKYAKPVGVVAALCPSMNPASTAVNKAMMAVNAGNAIVIAPSPLGRTATVRSVELMRAELARAGFPADLVQILPGRVTKEQTQALMRAADLVVATGSSDNVRRAYESGTPAIGVGVGNVPVIIDETAELADAAAKIRASKTFDNGTSCSSENAVVIVDAVYDAALDVLAREGGYLAADRERESIAARLWPDGRLNRDLIARDAEVLARAFDLEPRAGQARFFMVEETGVGPDHPFSGEKLSLVLAVYRAADFDEALALTRDILDFQGKGHSCGIHTRDPARARRLAAETDVVRVLVNQAHTFGNGGGFDNGLGFTLSQGCGTWGGSSISENLSVRHFLNYTYLSTRIPEDRPSDEALFGAYWARHGR